MKRLTLVLLAVLGLVLAVPSIAGTYDGGFQMDGRHQFAPSGGSGGR